MIKTRKTKHRHLICSEIILIGAILLTGCHRNPHLTETATPSEMDIPSVVTEAPVSEEAPESAPTDAPETIPPETEPPHIHDYAITEEKKAGCYTDGYVHYACSCGESYTEERIAPGYHNWSEWKTVFEPTEESEGLKQRICKRCTAVEEKAIDKPPTSTASPETEPIIMDPAESNNDACQHNWQTVSHPEEGHYDGYAVCKCGYSCRSTDEWIAHTENYDIAEAILHHTSYAAYEEYVVDSPAYTEQVCSICGAVNTSLQ